MLKTFALLVTIANPNMAEFGHSYVIDYGLTQSDCAMLILDVLASDGFEIEPGKTVAPYELNMACEAE